MENELIINATLELQTKELSCVIDSQTINLETEIQLINGYEYYEGDYEIVPDIVSQTLETKSKVMKENFKITEIPTYEVSNENGTTMCIGKGIMLNGD